SHGGRNGSLTGFLGKRRSRQRRCVIADQLDQEVFPVPHVVVDGRGADAQFLREATNGELLPPFPVDEPPSCRKDLLHWRRRGSSSPALGLWAGDALLQHNSPVEHLPSGYFGVSTADIQRDSESSSQSRESDENSPD